MSRPSFDVAGLWEHDPAPQSDEGHGPTQPSRTVPVAPPPRPTSRALQKQASAHRPMSSPARLRPPAHSAESPSDSKGRTTARRTTVYIPTAPDAWLREQVGRLVNPLWPPYEVLKWWSHPVACVSVSTTGTHSPASSSGWSFEVGLVSLVVPFVNWMGGGGWAGQIRSVPYLGVMSWAVATAPLCGIEVRVLCNDLDTDAGA